MPADLSIRDTSVFRSVKEVHPRDVSQYRDCVEVYIYDGAVHRLVYAKINGDFRAGNGTSVTDVGFASNATATLAFRNDGTWDNIATALGTTVEYEWAVNIPYTVGADFWIRWTLNSGTAPATSGPFNQNTWYQLNASRQLSLTRTTAGISTCSVDVTIAADNTGKAGVTRTFTIEAERAS